MFFTQCRYELRILGKWVWLIPLVTISGVALLTFLYGVVIPQASAAQIAKILTGSLEMVLPLATALVIGTSGTRDAALEVQLALPTAYPRTTFLRVSLIVGWSTATTLLASAIIYPLGLWHRPSQIQTWSVISQWLAGQLVWAAPLFALSALTFCLALLLRSRAASSGVVGALWILESVLYQSFASTSWLQPLYLFPTTFTPAISFWLANRLELLAIALILFVLSWGLLQRHEALIQGAGGEEV